jgi:signal transduction histidine kinase
LAHSLGLSPRTVSEMPQISTYYLGVDAAVARTSAPAAARHIVQENYLQGRSGSGESVNDWYLPAPGPADTRIGSDRRAINRALREERKRIARDIHDYSEQLIVAVMLRLGRLEQNPTEAKSVCEESRRILAELDGGLRRISNGLRMASICNGTLPITLSRLAERWTTDTGIAITLVLEPVEFRDPGGKISAVAARIAQLMLNNVAKHAASATRVSICLRRLNDAIEVSVEDDGPGFSLPNDALPEQRTRSGLVYMEEHLAEIEGHLIIDSTVGIGTKAMAVIPVSGCS